MMFAIGKDDSPGVTRAVQGEAKTPDAVTCGKDPVKDYLCVPEH